MKATKQTAVFLVALLTVVPAYPDTASGQTLTVAAEAGSYSWDDQVGDNRWTSGGNWLPNATAGNPDYLDDVTFEDVGTAAVGTDTCLVDVDSMVNRLLIANLTAAHTFNIAAGTSLAVEDETLLGGGVTGSSLALRGGGRLETHKLTLAQGAPGGAQLRVMSGGHAVAQSSLLVGDNTGATATTGSLTVDNGGQFTAGTPESRAVVLIGVNRTSGVTRTGTGSLTAAAGAAVEIDAETLTAGLNFGSGSGNWATGTVDLKPAAATVRVEQLSLGTNVNNTGTFKFGTAASRVEALNADVGHGTVEIGALGELVVSNRLRIGSGPSVSGYCPTGTVTQVAGSRLSVGAPEAPAELTIGRQTTAGASLWHHGSFVSAAGARNELYLSRLSLGRNGTSGGAGNEGRGTLTLHAGNNTLAAGDIELGNETYAFGHLAFGATDAMTATATNVVAARGTLDVGARGTLEISGGLVVGQGWQGGVTGTLSVAAGGVLRVGSAEQRADMTVGRQMLASGNSVDTTGRYTATAGSSVDLRLATLTVSENRGVGTDNRAYGTLDLSALALVASNPAAGQAALDASAVRVGIGTDESQGLLRLPRGPVSAGALTVGGDTADRNGRIELDETVLTVSGAAQIKRGGALAADVGEVPAGLLLLDGASAQHAITNTVFTFTANPLQSVESLWGMGIAGDATSWIGGLTNSGAVLLENAGLDPMYRFETFYRAGEDRTYLGVDLALRAVNISPVGKTLGGRVYGTGGAENPQVYICWGDDDAGATSTSLWDHVESLGSGYAIRGTFTRTVSGVAADRVYFARCYVKNSTGEDWSDEAVSFFEGSVTLAADDAEATETAGNAGSFVITRPAALTNGALTVYYAITGTAANGADYAWLPGSVVIPSGEESVTIPLTPIDDEVWNEGDETATLTLAPGGYTIGAQKTGTVTIRDNENPADWARHMTVTLSGYTRGETLTNFPVVVKLHEGIPGFHYGDFASGTAGDLRFADTADTTLLDFEIERWQPGGESFVWVRVPRLSAGTSIRAYWGNAAMTALPASCTNGAVWAGGFAGVWHLREAGTASGAAVFADSTANGNHGTDFVNAAGQTGVANGGQEFDGVDDRISVPHAPSLNLTDRITVSAWVRPDVTKTYYERIVAKDWDTSWAFLYGDPDDSLVVGINAAARAATPANVLTVGSWNHVAFTYDKDAGGTDEVRIYVNGVRAASGDFSTAINADADDINIGKWDDGAGYAFDGSMDELRIAGVARSSNWIWACWANQADPEGFAEAGAVWPYALVRTGAATEIGVKEARLNGTLISEGGTPADVWVYWGTNDGQNVEAAWATNVYLGKPGEGPVGVVISNLTGETTYFYRFYAENASGGMWAEESARVVTALDVSQYAHRMQIPLWRYEAEEPLGDFPLPVALYDGFSFFDYDQFASPEGTDLRFTASNGTEVLFYEVEAWDTFGTSIVWVRIPEARARSYIWAYWGNPAAALTAPAYTTDGSVWSEDFAGVWHLNDLVTDGTTGGTNHFDATGNGNDAVQLGNNDQPAVLDRGQEFSTGDGIRAGDAESLDVTRAVTISAWVKLKSYVDQYGLLMEKGNNSTARNYGLWAVNNGSLYLSYYGGGWRELSTAASVFTLGEWHHVAGVLDPAGGFRALYLDGVQRAVNTTAVPALSANTEPLHLGSWGGTTWRIDGLLDEVRVEAAARSSNWIWTTWASQADPRNFAPLGVGWPRPAVVCEEPANVGYDSAVLRGSVLSTGDAPTRVWLYWGESDGGTTAGAWQHPVYLGVRPSGAIASTVYGLADVRTYHYRFYAENDSGTIWAPSSRSFTTHLNLYAIGGTNYIGENMDFEDAGTPRPGYPYVVWDWHGHNYVSVGKDGQLKPMRGNLMMEADRTTRPWETNFGAIHSVHNRHYPPYIDFSHYREAITNGTARFTFTFHYNRVSSAFDARVDTMVWGVVDFFNAANQELGSFGWPREQPFASDDDPATWEAATVTGQIHPDAVWARIRLGWNEDVFDEQSAGEEFRGNYFDNILFGLVFPELKDPRRSTAGMLIMR